MGTAVVKRLVSEGARVAVADLFEDSARAAAEPHGENAIAVQFAAADPAAVKAMVEKTVAQFGRLDILHNNAALTDPARQGQDTTDRKRDVEGQREPVRGERGG